MADKATFMKADLFETDFSKATVITMFLLPTINLKLRPKILNLKPGTRIVSNSFTMDDWQPDETATVTEGCTSVVHGAVLDRARQGRRAPGGRRQGDLMLTQKFQKVSGTLGGTPITEGSLRGDQITLTVGDTKYTGRVAGNDISGSVAGGTPATWSATRR